MKKFYQTLKISNIEDFVAYAKKHPEFDDFSELLHSFTIETGGLNIQCENTLDIEQACIVHTSL